MISEHFWQQSQLSISLQLFGGMAVIFLLVLVVNAVGKYLKSRGFNANKSLESRFAMQIFACLCWILSLAGVATLYVTVLPGLTPFSEHVNANLGLGVMVLFILWPLIAAQVIVGIFAAKGKWLKSDPVFTWMSLIGAYFVFLALDTMAIRAMYQ